MGRADECAVCDCGLGVDLPASPSCRAALSLPLVRYCRRHRHHLTRCHLCCSISSVYCFLIISASSSRHRACGSCPSPPFAPPSLSRNGEGLRAGCGLFRCRRLACFPNAVATPQAIWSAPISPGHLVRSCCFACADGGCIRCREVASTASPLERFNRFLKCCRINLLKLYGSSAWLCSTDTGGRFQSRRFVVPSSVPPRRGRADCLRPLRRRPFHPSCRCRLTLLASLPDLTIR